MSNPTHTNRTRNAGKITLHIPATARKASAALRSLTYRRTASRHDRRSRLLVAERRGFESGHELEDWLLAESQLKADPRRRLAAMTSTCLAAGAFGAGALIGLGHRDERPNMMWSPASVQVRSSPHLHSLDPNGIHS